MINKKEAIYARQSVDKKDSVSIEVQIEACKAFLKTDNYEIYFDKGYSAKTINRPRMNDLNKDIEDGKVSRVIAYKLDRISRNTVDFGNLLTFYEKHNIEFISTNEKFDTGSPIGTAMINIVMVFAQMEREVIAQRIADNYRFRSSTGKYFMGGGVPFGYTTEKAIIDGKKASIIIPNENSELLQEMFDRFTSGESITGITKDLNSRGKRTSNNKLWTSLAIKRILQNITPVTADEKIYNYLSAYGYNITNDLEDFDSKHGMCIFFKQKPNHIDTDVQDQVVAVGTHNPIISSDKYIKAQLILEKNKEKTSPKTSKNTFLAGMVKCKECGFSFGLKSIPRQKKKYLYYLCRSRLSRGNCDNTLYIKSDEFESNIIQQSIEYLMTKKNKSVIEVNKHKRNKLDNSDEIKLLENQIENLISNIGKGNSVVDDLLTKKITELQDKITYFKKEAINEQYEDTNAIDIDEHIVSLQNFDNYNMDDKIEIIKKIIDYIEISKDGKVKIHYMF
jgi:DNA invertase Pin-like site-specific DNA recombinase